MSALTRNDLRTARSTRPSLPSAPCCLATMEVTRRSTSIIIGLPAPIALLLPTSSWSKSATPLHMLSPSSVLSESTMERTAHHVLARLSSLPLYMNSFAAPPTTPGCVSHTLRSKSQISSGAHPSSSASKLSSSGWWVPIEAFSVPPAPSPPAPPSSWPLMHVASTGARCCSVFNLNPSVFTVRSRWMASVGMRIIGRSIITSLCVTPPPADLTSTRPPTVRSLSNHVCHSPPP
mmetsp:Transcript_6984/g.24668  ORF Transcript_6984/g.24668 Transcript_6984/m.24668 type:complete len:234 (+) Transcript_6984:1090-1791(+)